jgi:beta-N-acetylhexosaminidase
VQLPAQDGGQAEAHAQPDQDEVVSPYPGNAALGAVDDVSLTQAVYQAIGRDLAALGINFDLAPCADVLGAADSPAVGTRSFGADTGLVSAHTAAAVAGLQVAGVAACTKHFPGHGRTGTDTHEAVATIEGGLADLRLVDLPPFEAAIRAGTLAIMPSHLRVPELTGDLPATVSGAALTGLLRGQLGFTGVIVSDALEMRATRDMFGIPRAAVLAVAAGTDLLCLGRDGSEDDYLAVREALVAAVRDGALDGAPLEEAADRAARLRGGLARTRSSPPVAGGATPSPGLAAARRAVRVSGPRRTLNHPVIVEVEPRENIAAGRFGWGLGPWAPAGSVHRVSAVNGASAGLADTTGILADTAGILADTAGILADTAGILADTTGILAAAAGRSLVAVVRDAHRDESARSLIGVLLAARPDLILVEMGLPSWRPPRAPPTWPPTAPPGPARKPPPNCSGWHPFHDGLRRGGAGAVTSGTGRPMPENRWGTCIMALMRLSARADYALRAAIELAAASSGHVTADQLARAQQIPGKFLETILTQLRRAGLIRSQRGPDGGFWLARPAAEISLADIIRAIDGQLLGVRGERPENITYPGVAEPLQQVWIALRANERAVLEQVTLADIVSGTLPEMVRHLTENPSAWV